MKYRKISVKKSDGGLDFFFDDDSRWFYQTGVIKNEKQIKDWDLHLSRKMWYSPEVREETLKLMNELI